MEQVSNERYQEKAALRQASYTRKKASATQEKGLIIVHTGPGKGKTTAALGLAFRALGQGMKVGIVQFIKGAIPTGEAALVAFRLAHRDVHDGRRLYLEYAEPGARHCHRAPHLGAGRHALRIRALTW